MGVFSLKNNEDEMNMMLSELLLPGENLEAGVSAMIYDTGFFASRYPAAGYIGLTDSGRLIGWAIHVLGQEKIGIDFAYVTKVRVKSPLLSGKLVGQRDVWLEYNDGKKHRAHFLMQEKVGGGKFPNQAENLRRIEDELNYLKDSLPGK